MGGDRNLGIPHAFADNHEVQPSPFPFRSHWHRRIDAHMAAGSCTPEWPDASCSRDPPLPLRSHHLVVKPPLEAAGRRAGAARGASLARGRPASGRGLC